MATQDITRAIGNRQAAYFNLFFLYSDCEARVNLIWLFRLQLRTSYILLVAGTMKNHSEATNLWESPLPPKPAGFQVSYMYILQCCSPIILSHILRRNSFS